MKKKAPLTKIQYGIYIECMNHQGELCYNIPYLYIFDGKLETAKLANAIKNAITSHPTFFTKIELGEDSEPIQVIEEERNLDLDIITITDEASTSSDFGWFKEQIRPFNIIGQRLFHVALYKDAQHHYLLWDCHHLVNDGTSMQILLHDIEAAYKGETIQTEEPILATIASEEIAKRQSKEFEEAKQWYQEQFDCSDVVTQLLPDLEDANVTEGYIERTLQVSLREIEDFCKSNGIFKSTLFTTVYAYLLAVYNNEQQSLTRTVYNGRVDKRLAKSTGMYVHTLPVYCQFDDNTEILGLLRKQQEQMNGCRKHDIYSYMDVINDLHLESNNTFVWHGMLFSDNEFAGYPIHIKPLINDKEGDKLYFKAYILDNRLHIRAEYNANEYSEGFLSQFLDSYETVLSGFITKHLLKEIAIVNPAQLQLLNSYNDNNRPYDKKETIVSLFKKQVGTNADKIAVVYKDNKYTYQDVDLLSDRIASYILSKGLKTDDIVSILIPRCEWMAIASLGVLKAGCAYQPLDPTYPKERLNFMMQDANAQLLIADRGLFNMEDDWKGETLFTDEIGNLPTQNDIVLPDIQPSSLFILLYTSGSTGTPKGVMIEHQNMTAFCNMHCHNCNLDHESRVGAYASFGFDASVMEIWSPLINGASLHIIPEELRLDLIRLNEYFETNGITHTFMTTQVARQFVNEIENHSLISFITGGEKLADVTTPKYNLYNGYGPTESICYVTSFTFDKPHANIPIGKAVENMHLFVVDKFGRRLPAGAAGELWVSGPQVSRGYLNRPEKTEEVYIPNPFDNESPYDRVYRTGDIVRYLTDGTMQYVGRQDGQVKIRGFRIELKEVEGIIRQFPEIKDVTVQAFNDAGGGKFIAAYIVSDTQVDISALEKFILDEKPPYMVPAVTMQIEKIPLNQNQKVDKRALPEPVKPILPTNTATSSPLNILEEELKKIIGDVIKSDDFGITDILGYVGLTSISAIKVATAIYKKYGVSIDSKTLVKTGTLQYIENEILKGFMNPTADSLDKEEKIGLDHKESTTNSFPLSYAQTGVYIECMKAPSSTVYNIPSLVTFSHQTDTGKLKEAVEYVLSIHPQFFVHFESNANGVVQVYDRPATIAVDIRETTQKTLADYKHEFVQPFNLNQGPLYRAEIVKTESNVYLLLDVHHLVFDGSSFDIFLHELCTRLNREPLDKEDLDYAHYVTEEKEGENSEQYKEASSFFAQELGNLEGSTDLEPDLTITNTNGSNAEVSAPFKLSDVDEFCREHGITPAHLSLAAVFYTLARFANTDKVCITTISNGRSNLRIANTIGMFVNTLALKGCISDKPVIDFIHDVSESFDTTLQHENYPFAQIAADYDLKADIMFAYQIGVINEYLFEGQRLEIENLEIDTPKFHVAFYIKEVDGMPSVSIEYDDGLYSRDMMQALATSTVNTIEAFIRKPDASLTSVSLLNRKQVELLDSFNNTDIPYNDSETIVSLFCRQAKTTPDNIAVVYHEKKISYREVDELSDRIAKYLISKGLKAEDVVSILIPRCEWMVIASLGVLKAGCAYQPLDPSYPKERLTFMMQDANAKLLISDRELREDVNEWNGEVLFTDEIDNLPPFNKERDHIPVISPEALFILLYTSGSTGLPKGCQLEHRNLVAFCHWYQRYYELQPQSRVAAYASYGFDACMMDMYPALTCGASVYIIGEDIRLNLPDLNKYFENEGITHSFITTQVGYQFATNFDNQSLHHLSVGGEKLAAINPPEGYKLHNGYGPTECTIFTTTYCVDKYEYNIPIGKPLDNIHLYIVDKEGNRLPVGAAGELWVSGPQVSRGYLNRPDKTAETYISNPFTNDKKYATVYRTGDVVRYLGDGNIQFVGRRDGQVKVRGFRIELKEVEAVIRQYPGITDATVQAFDYDAGGKYIAAYIVSDKNIDIKALNQFIAEQKPPYMVPAATMQIDSIPLNQNQKVNRKALPAPVIQQAERDYIAPTNEVEKLLCDIFASILGVEQVSTSDNFFDMGGTSLMVTRIVIDVAKAGYNITYGDIFNYKTPAGIAQFILNEQVESNKPTTNQNDLAAFDYTEITKLLRSNTLEAFRPKLSSLGTVLITGATGYLGIHILHELISHKESPSIVCLIRATDQKKAERRLRSLLFYYFDHQFADLFGTRIHVVLGDVTQPFSIPFHIDTVFNCAANVKHFSKGTDIEDVNIGGADNCIEFCLQNNARLIHVSTYSTAGSALPSPTINHPVFEEQTLFWGQSLENKYAWSKFIAERNILDAITRRGLHAKIMRAGNIAARSTDGEFQMNFQSNAFMGRLRVYQMIGAVPFSQFDNTVEFSPVNETARAIVLLSQTPDECCLFHTFNHHQELLGDILERMSSIGINISTTTDEDFSVRMDAAQKDPRKAEKMAGMIAYMNMSHGQTLISPEIINHQTMQILYRLGFRWNITTWDYIDRMLRAINGLGFFNE